MENKIIKYFEFFFGNCSKPGFLF